MTQDIKATVAELERLERDVGKTTSHVDACFAQRDWNETALQAVPSLLAELRRLLAIEEAAVRYREASNAFYYHLGKNEDLHAQAGQVDTALAALFAALPPRKPSGGEEGR